MGTLILKKEDIYRGNLILVNREYRFHQEIFYDADFQKGEAKESLVFVTDREKVLLKNRAAALLQKLMEEMQGWRQIVLVSGFRTMEEQKQLWEESLAENGREFTEKFVAYPGHSEHQTGLAVDLGLKKDRIDFICPDFPYNGVCGKFRERAADFGFVERYPDGKEKITGIAHEPWHFRYVGAPHAAVMTGQGMVLEEYVEFLKQYSSENPYCYEKDGQAVEIFYVPAAEGTILLEMEDARPYSISGNNVDGYIVTRWGTQRTPEPRSSVKQEGGGAYDIFRMIAAFLVVAIHTSPLADFDPEADFFLIGILGRLAVPFFLMLTGYFVLGSNSGKSCGKSLYKTAILYAIGILLYFPIGMYAGHYANLNLKQAFRMLFFDGTFYHLWYFPACIIGIVLVRALGRACSPKGLLSVTAALYVLGLFGDSYYGALTYAPRIKAVYDIGFEFFSYTRNGIFMTPVFLALGASFKRDGKGKNFVSRDFFLLVLCLCLMTGEGFLLRALGWQRHNSMYLFLIPCMVCLFSFLSGLGGKARPRLRKLSMWIFLLHPAMIVAVRGGARLLGLTGLLVENNLVHYLSVCAISTAAAAALVWGRELLWKNRKPFKKKGAAARGRAWIELDRKALRENIRLLAERLPEGCRLMPAVKADAYGHGAVLVAKECENMGISQFCVACIKEGIELRQAGIRGDILILGYTCPEDFKLLLRYDLIQTIVDEEYAALLGQSAKAVRVHLAIDTGMHRLGIRSEEVEKVRGIFSLKGLRIEGMFTHFCASDSREAEGVAYTKRQAESFYRLAEQLGKEGVNCPGLHLASSYGVLNYPEITGDFARVGIALYGVLSTGEDTQKSALPLRPVLSLKARVASVKRLYPKEAAGYGMAFVAEEEKTIAVLAIGYGDGVPRELSCGNGEVLLGGKRARILGRICMDQMLVDVTEIPSVRAGDIAVVIGSCGGEEIAVGDVAAGAGTISNEILSRLGKRLERIFV